MAVIYHGYPRSTADLDFWYNPTLSNFQKIIQAFKEYGIDVSELEHTIFDPRKSFLRLKVDFLPSIIGNFTFREAKEKAEILKLNDVEISVIGYDDLIRNKTMTNRLKDQSDVEELIKRRKKSSKR